MKRIALLSSVLLCVITSHKAFAQMAVKFKDKGSDTIRTVYIWHADRLRDDSKDTLHKKQSLIGNVKLQEEKTFFYCDSVVLQQQDNIVEAFGNVHINDSDTTNIFAEYMKYLTDKKMVYFHKNVRLLDGKGTLFTEDLQYDMNQKIGIYTNGGRVVNGSTILTSKEGTYYADTKDVYFRKDVVMKDPRYELKADSLLYNTQSQLATFITQTYIRDSSGSTIVTKDGFYDLKNHRAQFGKRPLIKQGGQQITGDDVRMDEGTGISTATGNAIFKDSVQNLSVIGGQLVIDKKNNTFTATINPLVILKQEKDSIFITADTLLSGKFSDSLGTDSSAVKDTLTGVIAVNRAPSGDSSSRYLQAFHHVRIFSDSLQAVSDSLYYSGRDSIFRLFTNPIVWVGGNQITGDTIYLFTENKKPKRLYVFENGMIVNKIASNMFNQIRGTTINGYFVNGQMDYMRAKGNAECYYYAQDNDRALLGVNHSTADAIDMIFHEKALNKVVLRSDAEGTMSPLKGMNFDDMRLRNFKWWESKRPKTRFELFENAPKEKTPEENKEKSPDGNNAP